jgi:ATP-dependent DNA helicase RecG
LTAYGIKSRESTTVPLPLDLASDVTYLKGVGPRIAEKLNRLGISRVRDLLFYFPRGHEDRREVRLLKDVGEGEKATFRLRVIDQSEFFYRGRSHPKIKVADSSRKALLYCFNRGFLKNLLTPGSRVVLTGAYVLRGGVPVFSQFEIESDGEDVELGIIPVYRLTEGLSQRVLRRTIRGAVERFGSALEEDIPRFIRDGYRIKSKGELVNEVHFPRDPLSLRAAKEALSYEEFFKFQIAAALARERNTGVRKNRIDARGDHKKLFIGRLGFPLTPAQERVLGEIEEDLRNPRPMNRLLQGDVGCGKTIVALLAALHAIESGGQVALMAPTEILARQHASTVRAHLDPLGVPSEFLSGSIRGEERKALAARLERGEISLLVGTHALFSEEIRFRNLSLVIIDEQQKFGVLQRGSLRAKGDHPDCIVMSATPIPRTLSMTLYGDLDVSVIDEMPKGRAGVETEVVKQAEIDRVYGKVREEVGKGRQAYFVYPIIEESLAADMKNAVDSYERLRRSVFPELSVGLLHGRMDDEEKDKVMRMFKERKHHVLVSTSVVEVGVDVPNATVMVIEQAERFGLSNLHQLRGRIGRGEHRSVCFLVPDRSTGREAFDRLTILKETNDGFKIAEWDLKLRGPGEMFGTQQSGVPSFIIEDFEINSKLIYRAQKDARAFVSSAIGTDAERKEFLDTFMKSAAYETALLYFGG